MMKTTLLAVAACAVAMPAHALSIVSLHGGMAVPTAFTAVDTAVIVGGLFALTGVVAFRLVNR